MMPIFAYVCFFLAGFNAGIMFTKYLRGRKKTPSIKHREITPKRLSFSVLMPGGLVLHTYNEMADED